MKQHVFAVANTLILTGLMACSPQSPAQSQNGFDLSDAAVPAEQILSGGPPRDGIPAIDNPVFETVAAADWLDDDDRILGLSLNGVHKAYPLAIMNWHELVNDEIGGEPYVGYADSPRLFFPVVNSAPGPWHAKEWVLGASIGDQHRAWPFSELEANGEAVLRDELAGRTLAIHWDADNRAAELYVDGERRPALTAFWFAWYAFHPDTSVFRASD